MEVSYVVISVTFLPPKLVGFRSVCFAMCPLESDTTQSADKHIYFMSSVISMFGKSFQNVVAFIGEYGSTILSFSSKRNVVLIACAFVRYKFAVREVIAKGE